MQLVLPGNHVNVSICARKPLWSDVQGFMQASVEFHQMGFVRWARVLKVHDQTGWDKILELSDSVQ